MKTCASAIMGTIVALGISSSSPAEADQSQIDQEFKKCLDKGTPWLSCIAASTSAGNKFALPKTLPTDLQKDLKKLGTEGGGFGYPSAAQSILQRDYLGTQLYRR